MPQTILAIAAMLAVMILSLYQQRAIVDMYAEMIDDESEVMATGVALQVKAQILESAFDSKVSMKQDVSAGDLSVSRKFGPGEGEGSAGRCRLTPSGEGPYDVCDDVDDYHGIEWQAVPFFVHGKEIDFEVAVDVRYVDGLNPMASLESYRTSCFKEVRVRVRGKDMVKGLGGRGASVYEVREVVEHPFCTD